MSCQVSTNANKHHQNADQPRTPVQAQVLAALAEGATITDAARQAGVPRAAIYNWVATVPELAAWLENAARIRTLAFWDQVFELAETTVDTLRHFVTEEETAPNLRLRAALALTRLIQSHQPESLPLPPQSGAELPEQRPEFRPEPAVAEALSKIHLPGTRTPRKPGTGESVPRAKPAWTDRPVPGLPDHVTTQPGIFIPTDEALLHHPTVPASPAPAPVPASQESGPRPPEPSEPLIFQLIRILDLL